MKNRLLKRMMILGMSFSMAAAMIPSTAFAAEGVSVQAEEGSETPTEAPETQAPETQAPETQAPETQAPETQAPETQAPETQAPETQAPETQAPQTETQETQAQPVPQTETEAPATEATEPTTEIDSKDKKAKALTSVTAKGTPEIEGAYTEKDGNYTITGSATMTLTDCGVNGTVTVTKDGSLTLKVMGTSNIVKSVVVDKGGKLIIDKSSTGAIKSDFTINGTMELDGGTLTMGSTLDESLAKGADGKIKVTGGTIAYPTTAELENGSGVKVTAREMGSVTPDRAVKVSDLKVAGSTVTYGTNGIWSAADGKLYLCVADAASLTAEVYDVTVNEKGNEVKGTIDTYKGNSGSLSKQSGTTAYILTAGVSLSMTYGTLPGAQPAATAEKATIASAKLSGGADESKFEIKEKKVSVKESENKVSAGEYTAEVTVTDTLGYTIKGDVKLSVAKKALTITKVSADDKVYDGTTTATGSLTFDGQVSGDVITYKADYNFASADAAASASDDAASQTVTASNIKLDSEWADKYELEETKATGTATISKAPCGEKAEKPSFYYTYSYDKTTSTWKYYLKWKALPGQEYSTNEKSWKENTSSKTKTYMLNVKTKDSVKIFTRIAETKNYLASDVVNASDKVHKPVTVSSDGVAVEGIVDGENYKTNSTLKFKAIGVNPGVSDKDLSYGDEKYLPYSWKLIDTTVWTGAPYTGTIDCSQNGTYTVVVSYHKYVYATNDKDKLEWTYDENGDVVKKIVFKVSAKGKAVTTNPDGTTTTTGAGSGTGTTTATAAKTADTTPIAPIAGAFGASGLAAFWLMRKKKKYTK